MPEELLNPESTRLKAERDLKDPNILKVSLKNRKKPKLEVEAVNLDACKELDSYHKFGLKNGYRFKQHRYPQSKGVKDYRYYPI